MSKPDLKIYNPKTYNHAFDLAFEVAGSAYEDGYECLENEKELVMEALYRRVDNIFREHCDFPNEYLDAFGSFDTYCENDDE